MNASYMYKRIYGFHTDVFYSRERAQKNKSTKNKQTTKNKKTKQKNKSKKTNKQPLPPKRKYIKTKKRKK